MSTSARPTDGRSAFGRILICRTDNIGDVVLTLPLAGYLKQRFHRRGSTCCPVPG
ncbi:hypothetical protein ACFOY5_02580 [Massilia aurea]|uniref:hypothetical protein n=1 Tax=Massilia aurea TaxID=373040 RepID=UPI0021627339|nr:hypothetical protein [Massilia aurea]MCS0707082.1 hypothetical protein [Massilia aurea]